MDNNPGRDNVLLQHLLYSLPAFFVILFENILDQAARLIIENKLCFITPLLIILLRLFITLGVKADFLLWSVSPSVILSLLYFKLCLLRLPICSLYLGHSGLFCSLSTLRFSHLRTLVPAFTLPRMLSTLILTFASFLSFMSQTKLISFRLLSPDHPTKGSLA